MQKKGELDIEINTSPVHLEITGCYVKYTFPKEIMVSTADLTSFSGYNLMLAADNSAGITPVARDLAGATKFVIMKGCQAAQYVKPASRAVQFPNFKMILGIKMKNVQNPYGQRTTSEFLIEVFKDYNSGSGALSKKILETRAKVDQSLFTLNEIKNFALSALVTTVQEKTTHSFAFDSSSEIPSTAEDA